MSAFNDLRHAQELRLNFDRARLFGCPILRSLHPDAALVGYSVTATNGIDVMVEANHVLVSTLGQSRPKSLTTRTWKYGSTVSEDWRLHAIDHLLNTHPNYTWRDPRDARDVALGKLEHSRVTPVKVLIDEKPVAGKLVHCESLEFICLQVGQTSSLVTIAAPPGIVAAGFTSSVEP